ncbi:flagellar motor switch protein FliN [Clostridium sp. DL1XJH146]
MDDFLSSEEIDMLLENSGGDTVKKKTGEVFTEFNDKAQVDNLQMGNGVNGNLDLILDIPLEVSVVLGKAKKSIKEITSVVPGSVIELDKAADEPLEIYANGKKIAEGEAIVINEKFCVRITKIVSRRELISNL